MRTDALQFSLPIDNYLTSELYHLAPHMSTFSMDQPRTISSSLAIPKPVIANIANWIEDAYEKDPVKLERMRQLVEA